MPLERFEFTIGEDTIPFYLGAHCFADVVQEV